MKASKPPKKAKGLDTIASVEWKKERKKRQLSFSSPPPNIVSRSG
jgi:hypothetical protein